MLEKLSELDPDEEEVSHDAGQRSEPSSTRVKKKYVEIDSMSPTSEKGYGSSIVNIKTRPHTTKKPTFKSTKF